jgi:hypothetical protein
MGWTRWTALQVFSAPFMPVNEKAITDRYRYSVRPGREDHVLVFEPFSPFRAILNRHPWHSRARTVSPSWTLQPFLAI